MDKLADSKVARQFLRMILKDFGKPVNESIEMNSWELFDLISKEISLGKLEKKRLISSLKYLDRKISGLSQLELDWHSAERYERERSVREAIKTYVENK